MQVFKSVLSQDTLSKCHEEVHSLMGQAVWRCSDQFWGEEIKVGVTGVCTSTFVSPDLLERIKQDLASYLPVANEVAAQHYIWHKHSGISIHNDWAYNFAATIYLNPEWNLDWGGLFMWRDPQTLGIHGHVPEYNTMVLNTQKTEHFVTLMSPMAPVNRFTLQIWGM